MRYLAMRKLLSWPPMLRNAVRSDALSGEWK